MLKEKQTGQEKTKNQIKCLIKQEVFKKSESPQKRNLFANFETDLVLKDYTGSLLNLYKTRD